MKTRFTMPSLDRLAARLSSKMHWFPGITFGSASFGLFLPERESRKQRSLRATLDFNEKYNFDVIKCVNSKEKCEKRIKRETTILI